MKREKFVWVIVGLNDCSDNFQGSWLVVNELHAAHTSYEKARIELLAILTEGRQEAEDNGYVLDYTLKDDTLEMNFAGSREYYKIFKLNLN